MKRLSVLIECVPWIPVRAVIIRVQPVGNGVQRMIACAALCRRAGERLLLAPLSRQPGHSGSWQKIGTEKLFTRNAAPCGWRGSFFFGKCVSLCGRDEGIAKEEKGYFPSPLLQSPGKRQAGRIRGRLPKAGALRRNLTCRTPESPAVQSAAYIRLCCAPCCMHRRRCMPHNRPMRTGQPVRRPRPTWPTPRIRCRRPG